MNQIFNIRVLASGCYGIAPLVLKAEYNGDPKEFQKHVMSLACSQGYTSILHFQAVNGIDNGKIAFCPEIQENAQLVEYILSLAEKAGNMNQIKESLEKSRKTGEPANDNCFQNPKGEWVYMGGFNEHRAREVYMHFYHELQGIKNTLRLLGVDVDDEQGKHQILTNLGFYRTPIK